MLTFQTERVTPRITRIFGFNTELMYLVEGERRAALIDTGSGFGDLKRCAEGLTDKPLIVLLTHGHTDHAMGAGQFGTVYMNHADDEVFAFHGRPEFRWASLAMCPIRESITPADCIPTDHCARFLPLAGGDSFDLGGLHIDVYPCPGHTPGSVVLLLREERLLLLGDACNGLTFLFDRFSTGVRAYRDSLKALQAAAAGKYDGVLLSHTGGTPTPELIPGNIQNCEDILAGNTDDQPFVWNGETYKLCKAFSFESGRLDGGVGNIVYSDDTKFR